MSDKKGEKQLPLEKDLVNRWITVSAVEQEEEREARMRVLEVKKKSEGSNLLAIL